MEFGAGLFALCVLGLTVRRIAGHSAGAVSIDPVITGGYFPEAGSCAREIEQEMPAEAKQESDTKPEEDTVSAEEETPCISGEALPVKVLPPSPQKKVGTGIKKDILKLMLNTEIERMLSKAEKLKKEKGHQGTENSVHGGKSGLRNLVVFELDCAGAKSVALAGDFNNWCSEPGDDNYWPFIRDKDGVWRTLYYLPAGEHRYKFVVDGKKWISDPSAAACCAGQNSIIEGG